MVIVWEREGKRERYRDLAWILVKMKSRNEFRNEVVDFELKGMSGVEVKVNYCIKIKKLVIVYLV